MLRASSSACEQCSGPRAAPASRRAPSEQRRAPAAARRACSGVALEQGAAQVLPGRHPHSRDGPRTARRTRWAPAREDLGSALAGYKTVLRGLAHGVRHCSNREKRCSGATSSAAQGL